MALNPQGGDPQSANRARELPIQLPSALALAHTLARQLMLQRDPAAMAQLVVDALIQTFHYDHAAFLRVDEQRPLARVEAEAGRLTGILPGQGFEIDMRQGIVGHVLRSGESYLAHDTARDPFFIWPVAGPRARSELCVPVKSPSRLLGVIDLMSFEPGFYQDADRMLVEILAAHLAMAIEHALLYGNLGDQVSSRTAELRTLVEISSQLLAAGQLEDVLRIIMSHASQIARWANRASVLLYDPFLQALRPLDAQAAQRPALLFSPDHRIVGRVFRSGQALLCSSRGASAGLFGQLAPEERNALLALVGDTLPVSIACVPLQVEQTVIGVLLLSGSELAALEDGLAPLQTLANLTALGVQHMRLLEREQAQRNSALTLLHLSGLVARSLSLEEVQERVVELAQAQFAAQAVWLFLYDPEHEQLVLASVRGWPRDPRGAPRLHRGQGVAGRVLATRSIQCVPNIGDDPDFILRDDAMAFGLRSMVGAPLIAQDEVVGVLCLSAPALLLGARLDADQETLLTIFANQAAMAIANARLHQKTLQQSWEAHMLAEASQRFASSLEPERVAAVIAQQTAQILDDAYVLLLTPGTAGALSLAAGYGSDPERYSRLLALLPALQARLPGAWREVVGPLQLEDQALARIDLAPLLALPLSLQDRLLGVLLVGCRQARATARQPSDSFIYSLADRAALALENARLYSEQVELLAELKEMQSHLVRSETLAATGRLAASLAHEINNPLAIIRASLGMARTRMGEDHPAWIELADIDEELDRISRITRSLLDFSHSPAPLTAPTDLNHVIETLVRVILPRLNRQEISLEWRPDPLIPRLAIPADSLKQILLNLVTNAIDAMPEGGTLVVSTQMSRKQVVLAVRDSGVGIAREQLGRIFDPFFTTKREGGTGLGLAILDRLVRSYGGTVEVETSLGQGSTFRILLPITASSAQEELDAYGAASEPSRSSD